MIFRVILLTAIFIKYNSLIAQQTNLDQRKVQTRAILDSGYRAEIFSLDDVERMKQFFLKNAALPEQPRNALWNPTYRHKCINTVRAGIEILLFGNSSIPDSLFSRREVFNGDFQTNNAQSFADHLVEKGYLNSPDSFFFVSKNRGEWVTVYKNDEQRRYLRPTELKGSLWYSLLGLIGKIQGYSVFIISICDGYHAAVITVDHRNLNNILIYWSDQTHRHPYRYLKDGKLKEVPNAYGWEVMNAVGPDTLRKGIPRGLDEYVLYAVNKYWCDCNRENQEPDDCCAGNCFPLVQIWRVRKPRVLP